MNRKEAKAKGKRFYIGALCQRCGNCRKRYTSNGACRDCYALRDRREDMPAHKRDLVRARDRQAKRAKRAKDKAAIGKASPWHALIASITNQQKVD